MLLKTKAYDVFMIILIIIYTLLIFVFFAFDDVSACTESEKQSKEDRELIFYIIELAILGLFVIEIALHIYAYNLLYLRDIWNLIDFIVIILSVIFVLLDMFLPESGFKNILRIRGIFRMLRVFLLVRKLNTLRVKRELLKQGLTDLGYDLRSPLEKVIDILKEIQSKMHSDEDKIKTDIDYCLKIIQSGKLYEVNLEDQDGEKN